MSRSSDTALEFEAHLAQVHSDPGTGSHLRLQIIDDLVQQMVVHHLQTVHSVEQWEHVDLLRMSFSQGIRALSQCGDADLSAHLSRYRDHRNRNICLSDIGPQDVDHRLEIARELLDRVGCGGVPVHSRVPRVRREVNAVAIESVQGYRTFYLEHGDLLDTTADLLVYAAGHDEGQWRGRFVRQLNQMYRVESPVQPLLHINEACMTGLQPGNARTPFSHSLLVNAPKSKRQWTDDRAASRALYDEVNRGIWASVAALEQMGHKMESVALSPILTSSIPDYAHCIDSLLSHGIQWLKRSEHTHSIRFVVFFADELEVWSEALDRRLGRRLISAGQVVALEDLVQHTLVHIKKWISGPHHGVLRSLQDALNSPGGLRIERVCIGGRRLVEEVLHHELKTLDLPIERSLMANIERLRGSNRAAPWVCSYMHMLRIMGNEMVHDRSSASPYFPAQLQETDLIGALTAIQSVLSFRHR